MSEAATQPAPVDQWTGSDSQSTMQRLAGQAKKLLRALASLKLSVLLFFLSALLVFFGTLAQTGEGIWAVVNDYFRSAYVWVPLAIFFPKGWQVGGAFLFPGGWLLGGLLMTNLLAAHLVRFRLAWKQCGIWLIHAGIVVIMISEFVTGTMAVEGSMVIEEGKASNFVQHTRAVELVFIEPVDAEQQEETVIPGSRLAEGRLIRDPLLPFDVRVDRYMVNSDLQPARSSQGNPATAGVGLQWVAIPRKPASGTDSSLDLASAYVTLLRKGSGQPLGTYLVSVWLTYPQPSGSPQKVSCDGRQYEIQLRFKRTYKPYTVHLIDFRHDTYIGTDTPKDFSSVVRLIDPTRGEDRRVRIYMNHPLRYAGETLYQSAFLPGDTGTILQVVRNPGWLMPYIACVLVSLGMLVHFGLRLIGFLGRRAVS